MWLNAHIELKIALLMLVFWLIPTNVTMLMTNLSTLEIPAAYIQPLYLS